jgi:hypothetical protein
MGRPGGADGRPPEGAKTLKKKILKISKNDDFSLLSSPFFAIIFPWKMPTGSRDVPAPETRILLKSERT